MAAKSKKINRTEIINKLSSSMSVSKSEAESILNSVLQTITDLVISGYNVNLTGFGSFYTVIRKSRKGVNPKTKQAMQIPASTSVGFRVGKTFKEAVKGK